MTNNTRKLTALLTVLCFCVTQLWVPEQSFGSSSARISEVNILSPFRVTIPQELGTIETVLSGNGPAVIHIQEAHGNYAGQKNIQTLLHYLKNQYGFNLILLEGNAFKLEPELARLFPSDKEFTIEVLDELLKKQTASGPELFFAEAVTVQTPSVIPEGRRPIRNPDAGSAGVYLRLDSGFRRNDDQGVPLRKSRGSLNNYPEEQGVVAYGIENLDAYVENGQAFKAVLTARHASEKFLGEMDLQIDRLAAPYLNKELREFLKHTDAYELGHRTLEERLSNLKQLALKHLEIDLLHPVFQLDWPMLLRVFTLKNMEAKLDLSGLEKERPEFLAAIRPYLSDKLKTKRSGASHILSFPGLTGESSLDSGFRRNDGGRCLGGCVTLFDEIKRLLSMPLSNHKLPDPETGLLFEQMVSKLPLNFNHEAYPNVKLLIGHMILQSELKANLLFGEIERLADLISEKLGRTEEEKNLIRLFKDYRLLKKLFALELTPEEYEEVEARNRKQETGCRMQDAGCGKQDARCRMQETGSGKQETGNKHSGSRKSESFKIQHSKFPPHIAADPPSILADKTVFPIRPSQIAARFLEVNTAKRVRDIAFTHLDDLDSLFEKALDFYRGAKARDTLMLQNIERILADSAERGTRYSARGAVLITGGFHSGPFQEYFKDHGYNYALISPRISAESDHEAYVKSILESFDPQTKMLSSTLMKAQQIVNPRGNLLLHRFDADEIERQILEQIRTTGRNFDDPTLQAMIESSPYFLQRKLARRAESCAPQEDPSDTRNAALGTSGKLFRSETRAGGKWPTKEDVVNDIQALHKAGVDLNLFELAVETLKRIVAKSPVDTARSEKVQQEALEQVLRNLKRTQNASTGNRLVDLALRLKSPQKAPSLRELDKAQIEFFDKRLLKDKSQEMAVRIALHPENEMSLIHGPAGSGKTFVITELARQFARQGKRVLITTYTNEALDNALDTLVAMDETTSVGRAASRVEAITKETLRPRIIHKPGDLQRFMQAANHTFGLNQEILQALGLTPLEQEEAKEIFGTSVFETLIDEPVFNRIMLTTNYRLHWAIAKLVSELFYENRLAAERIDDPLLPDTFKVIDTRKEPNHGETPVGTSFKNEKEAALVIHEIKRLLREGIPPEEIGVISFYQAQIDYLQALMKESLGLSLSEVIKTATVDSFQGREKRVVVISPARSNKRKDVGFLNDKRRLNVALSRAKNKLIVIGDFSTLSESSPGNRVAGIFERLLSYSEELRINGSEEKEARSEVRGKEAKSERQIADLNQSKIPNLKSKIAGHMTRDSSPLPARSEVREEGEGKGERRKEKPVGSSKFEGGSIASSNAFPSSTFDRQPHWVLSQHYLHFLILLSAAAKLPTAIAKTYVRQLIQQAVILGIYTQTRKGVPIAMLLQKAEINAESALALALSQTSETTDRRIIDHRLRLPENAAELDSVVLKALRDPKLEYVLVAAAAAKQASGFLNELRAYAKSTYGAFPDNVRVEVVENVEELRAAAQKLISKRPDVVSGFVSQDEEFLRRFGYRSKLLRVIGSKADQVLHVATVLITADRLLEELRPAVLTEIQTASSIDPSNRFSALAEELRARLSVQIAA